MKFSLSLIFLSLSSFIFSQTIEDSQTIIQECIDLAELQQYLEPNEIDGNETLIILNDGVLQTDLKLYKFGSPVKFMTKKVLFFNNIRAFLDFDEFEFSDSKANLEFHYNFEGLTILITFEKTDNDWKIKSKKIFEK
jgi:hypothetical protein